MTGVGPQHTPATRIWFGKASNPPGSDHCRIVVGEAEKPAPICFPAAPASPSVRISGLRGNLKAVFGACRRFLPHLEANMSTTEELWWLACRTPENIVVNLPDISDSLLAGYRRA